MLIGLLDFDLSIKKYVMTLKLLESKIIGFNIFFLKKTQ